ncbi:MAG: hypothetical protein ACQEQC_07895 [Elusimicrobiota bacterium]
MKKYIFVLLAFVISGCTTAGPFVTNISSDGRGNLIIEKSRIQFNSFTGTLSNKEGSTQSIKIIPEDKSE